MPVYANVYKSFTTSVRAVRPGTVGERGMDGDAAPGAFTPTKGAPIRFFDGELTTTLPERMMVPYHNVLGSVRVDGASLADRAPVLHTYYGPTYVDWAWYGEWRDLNGNGVIDHFTPGTGAGQNEFTWFGSCVGFINGYNADAVASGLCRDDPNPNESPPGKVCPVGHAGNGCARTTLTTWLWPGNHPDGGLLLVSNNLPGNQVVRWVQRGFDCSTPPTCDDEAAQHNGAADPLLDDQTRLDPDGFQLDVTGDPEDSTRMWYGLQLVNNAYDDGLLTTLLAAWGVNCRPAAGQVGYDLDSCTFTDVDLKRGVHPVFDTLLYGNMEWAAGGLKGTASSQWTQARVLAEHVLPDLPGLPTCLPPVLLVCGPPDGGS